MNMNFKCKLPIPAEMKERYPASSEVQKIVNNRNEEICNIIMGKQQKILLIIGPCSADNEDSVMDYVCELANVQDKVKDKVFIVPHIYTNKPRSIGKGYKGIVAIRKMHLRVIKETGFTCADEMLYPENHRYLNDLLGYVAIGARSVENQQHRLTASGLNIPVGMKNPTGGNISIMMNSIEVAQCEHTFLYRGWEVSTTGNPLTHAILRGYENKYGQHMSNYHYDDLQLLCENYNKRNLKNPAVIVDTNHSNSGKCPLEQLRTVKEVLNNCRYNEDIRKIIKGFMVESYIKDGAQKIDEHIYGKSITDSCLGWNKTERLIYEMAELL